MELDRKKIKETFLHELQFRTSFYRRYRRCDFCEGKMDNIEEALNDICDLSMNMSYLNEFETFVVRKQLGVYDNGERQKTRTIAEVTGRTIGSIQQIETQAYRIIINALDSKAYYPKD